MTKSKNSDQDGRKARAASHSAPPARIKTKRREQQRSIETRLAILDAALEEFAERGFDGASIRRIGERADIDFTLITYHFKNKENLWQSVARHSFEDILVAWDEALPPEVEISAKDKVRILFRSYFEFTCTHRAFHNFMLRESHSDSERLRWLADEFLGKIRSKVIPEIRKAQEDGQLVQSDPDILYYMLIGATATLSSMSGEIGLMTRFKQIDQRVANQYWLVLERLFFS